MTDENGRSAEIAEIVSRYRRYGGSVAAETGIGEDEYYMTAALELAAVAARYGDVPVGCVIVRDGELVGAECNGREYFHDALYHAETAAISAACRRLGGWRLTRSTLYVTLEPCPMCAGAICNARIPRIVVGAKDAKSGATGSLLDLNSYPLNHKFAVTFGVLERDSRSLLLDFFHPRRSAAQSPQT